ncbi:FmdE family protein [Pseudodesulfovibrio indicus]|uniref:FmdE protein associated with molybdenum formylmethanofuran dehydrogenase n=2 Tax=Pseudodesulfovibrio indicus TaxID=1716143 RepID=A0AA94TI38_9BACT|nr:FmdE family protein [Pseudodesulfovibrio indicus]TDT86506.1 FmdE protein associated with molybdenum formylmethanofuran dehydrogenase [Pseudodesulfovibrio indicus]
MKLAMKSLAAALVLLLCGAGLGYGADFGPAWTPGMKTAGTELQNAMARLKVTPDTEGFLAMTNAGYGEAEGASTEAYLDVIGETTGRTPGTRTLLAVDTPCSEPLWFALCNRDTGQLEYLKLTGTTYATQTLDIRPESIFRPEVWGETAKGPLGPRLFTVASITLAWSAGADWRMLKGAELHDHFCPGLNAGFIAKGYLDKNLPLGPGDRYVFIGAPSMCAMDALQSVYGATVGKSGAFSMYVPEAAKRNAVDGVAPSIIALRVNAKKDACDGLVLGFDWSASEKATGVTAADRSPKGGKSNPLFFISRVKMSWKLAQMPLEEKLAYIKVLRELHGPASLAAAIQNGGADPYAAIQ